MNSRQIDRLEDRVKRARTKAEDTTQKSEAAYDQAYPEERAAQAGQAEGDVDIHDHHANLKQRQSAQRKADQELKDAIGALDLARFEHRLQLAKHSLADGAAADFKVRDERVKLVRVRINQTGAAIIATSIGILIVRRVSAEAQFLFVAAIHAAAYSGAAFILQWMAEMLSSHVVGSRKIAIARRLKDPIAQIPVMGRVRDSIARNGPWILSLLQTGLVAASGLLFIGAVVNVADGLRGP